MSIDLVFNELSASPQASDKYAARQRMTALIQTVLRARRQGISGTFRIPDTFHAMILAPNYLLTDWRYDVQVDEVERLFFMKLATNSPFLEGFLEAQNRARSYDFKLDLEKAQGCGVAFLLNALSISLQSESRWDVTRLTLIVEHFDDIENIVSESAEIVYASSAQHIAEHSDWIKNRLAESVESGADMWERRGELFPSLTFCSSVEKQMCELEYGTSMLQPVAKHLFDLQGVCRIWTTGSFNPAEIPAKVSPESPVTLSQFGAERTFWCPDGVERVFSWHLKINWNAWRIHFDFDNAKPSAMIIGYIGKHLPTASDRT